MAFAIVLLSPLDAALAKAEELASGDEDPPVDPEDRACAKADATAFEFAPLLDTALATACATADPFPCELAIAKALESADVSPEATAELIAVAAAPLSPDVIACAIDCADASACSFLDEMLPAV